jgi:uncharacterized membrane protein
MPVASTTKSPINSACKLQNLSVKIIDNFSENRYKLAGINVTSKDGGTGTLYAPISILKNGWSIPKKHAD